MLIILRLHIYLLHPDIGWKFISVAKYIAGESMPPFLSGIIFVTSIFISILAAHLLHLAVEVPSLKALQKD